MTQAPGRQWLCTTRPSPEGAMRQRPYTLTRQDVHAVAMQHLLRHLDLGDLSPRCTGTMLVSAVVAAAAGLTPLIAVARRLLGLPSGETLRKALLANLSGRAALERRLNRALAAALPRGLARRRSLWPST